MLETFIDLQRIIDAMLASSAKSTALRLDPAITGHVVLPGLE